jgi:hypothetical protein
MATLALADGDPIPAYLSAASIVFLPMEIGMIRRAVLLIFSFLVYFLGPTILIFVIPAALIIARMQSIAAISMLALTSSAFLAHHIQSIPNFIESTIHPSSFGFVIIPTMAVAAILGIRIGWRALFCLVAAVTGVVFLIEFGAERWINHATLTSPWFRISAVLLIPCVVFPWIDLKDEDAIERGNEIFLGAIFVGVFASLLIPNSQIKSVVFDESHGRWETVQSSFGPNDFGRAVNYTYSLLFAYSAQLVGKSVTFDHELGDFPNKDAMFVLKMPTKELSSTFSTKLKQWVRAGGRLLVVADHTDLYNSSQYLNRFLSKSFDLRINSDAVFNSQGMPAAPNTKKSAVAIGRIVAFDKPLPWQTGSSLATMPLNTVQLATFGPSFSEPGDYSRPNRFGTFTPRVSLRFLNHTAVAGFGFGKGAFAIITDSTPWSNFSIFGEHYKHLFRGIVQSLSRPIVLHVWGWSSVALGLILIVMAIFRIRVILAIGGLTMGLALGTAAQIGSVSFDPLVEGRDFGLKAVLGKGANIEFLKQLVPPGERNYSRIISAMSKYNLSPTASLPGTEITNLKKAKNWLLIQPNKNQLPSQSEIIEHLGSGANLTILFSPNQSTHTGVRTWLQTLGIYAQESVALAMAEDARSIQEGLLYRRGAALIRDIRTITKALPTSILKERDADQFFQSYTVRPTVFPRKSGILNLSFSADQFSDNAVGEVWEGVQPTSIGKLRERQLAAVLTDKDMPAPFPVGLIAPSSIRAAKQLENYLMLEDGKTILTGKFKVNGGSITHDQNASPIENPAVYLRKLRDRSASFIAISCPWKAQLTVCQKRMLGPDVVEWMVSWTSNNTGDISAIELLHERNFSGLGKTINVIFGE